MARDDDDLPLGSRVVVRWRLEGPDPLSGATLTDAVGTLLACDEDSLTVQSARGPVTVERARVVAVKEVPPKPSRRGAPHRAISVPDLQRVMAPSWGALERESLGEWELRASEGFTQRGNSVVPVGDPGVPVAEAVAFVERWYAARGLPAKVALGGPVGFDPADDPLGALLLGRGYTVSSLTLNLTAPTQVVAAADPGGPPVLVSPTPPAEWLATYLTTRSTVPGVSERVVTGSPRQLFGHLTALRLREWSLERPSAQTQAEEGTPIALGRLGIAHGWAGLGAVWTNPAYRGRGLAAHLTARLAATAREDGTHLMHLQVEQDNRTAIRLYQRMGFETHSSYVYLTQPQPAGG
jgi:GNAT superfamily N-acetyltransferase